MATGGPHDRSPLGTGKNWVTKVGGLPGYIREIAHALIRAGHPESESIQIAIGRCQAWARGQGNVSAATRAKAAAAIAEWEAKKGASRAKTAGAKLSSTRRAAQREILMASPTAAVRKTAAKQGKALPDGSFPIRNRSDLVKAIHLAGNAKDPAKARAFICRRAKALGLDSLIPDTWPKYGAANLSVPALVQRAEAIKDPLVRGPARMRVADLANAQAESVVDLAGRWKHGWIPLDAEAVREKAKKLPSSSSARGSVISKRPGTGISVVASSGKRVKRAAPKKRGEASAAERNSSSVTSKIRTSHLRKDAAPTKSLTQAAAYRARQAAATRDAAPAKYGAAEYNDKVRSAQNNERLAKQMYGEGSGLHKKAQRRTAAAKFDTPEQRLADEVDARANAAIDARAATRVAADKALEGPLNHPSFPGATVKQGKNGKFNLHHEDGSKSSSLKGMTAEHVRSLRAEAARKRAGEVGPQEKVDRIKNAETMFGTGSKQHEEAKRRFGVSTSNKGKGQIHLPREKLEGYKSDGAIQKILNHPNDYDAETMAVAREIGARIRARNQAAHMDRIRREDQRRFGTNR